MAYKINIGAPIEEVAKHFAWFFPSLQEYKNHYIHRCFVDPANVPEHHAYLCPMCLTNGIILLHGADLVTSSQFSQDHFPPKSVGGSHTLLVCRDCNSNAGGAFDFSLKDQVMRMAVENRTPLSTVNAVTTITGVPGNYKGTFSIDELGESVLGFNAEGKSHATFLNQWLTKPVGDWEAKVVIRNPDQDKVAKALVRAAYLFCFGTWGYGFAFSKPAELIRRYLAGECEYPFKTPVAWLGGQLTSEEPVSIPAGPCYLLKPVEARCIVVNIPLVDQETGFKEIAVIAMPKPGDIACEELARQQEVFNDLLVNRMTVSIGHANNFTLTQGVYDGYDKSWQHLSEL